jgi:glyoxylase-like metal-dependent hydrolase (beta-lactamase superfamily II)
MFSHFPTDTARLTGLALSLAAALNAHAQAPGPTSPRLYVLDGGVLESDPARYGLAPDDVETPQLSVAAYLVVHARGVLLWDAGAVADDARSAEPAGTVKSFVLPAGGGRTVTLAEPLLRQLDASGYAPADVTHLALSHWHWDHVANANDFAHATWLVNPAERAAMFETDVGRAYAQSYGALEASETVLLTQSEHDVFGDGTVVIHQSPGHTPGHIALFVDLADTGPVVLTGDLYHYAAERRLGKVPGFDFDPEATAESRRELEVLLERMGAALWIQHDLPAHRRLEKAPRYYD